MFVVQTISYTVTLFVTNYCFQLAVIIGSYYHIVQAIFHHEKELREQAKKMNVTSLRSNANANGETAEFRIAKCALVNITLWVAMWTPYAAIVLQGAVGDQSKITPLVTILPALICKTASIYNPIIFAISHPKYRLVSAASYLVSFESSSIDAFCNACLANYMVWAPSRHCKRLCPGCALTKRSQTRATANPLVQLIPRLKSLFLPSLLEWDGPGAQFLLLCSIISFQLQLVQ